MEISRAFDQMIKHCEKMDLPRVFKNDVISKINFIKTQALCDSDRRVDITEIKRCWDALERLARGSILFEVCRRDHDGWPEILAFVGTPDPKYKPLPGPPKSWEENRQNPYSKWTPHEFFVDLRSTIRQSLMTKDEYAQLYLGTSYMIAAAALAAMNRNQIEIKRIWSMIWPTLDKYKILDRYKRDASLKRTIANFIGQHSS